MRIAVISDTHEKLPEELCAAIAGADEIWHLGDVTAPYIIELLETLGPPVRVVRGNCDFKPEWPESLDLEVEGFRIRLTHIPPRKLTDSPDLLLHGHTHVPRNEVLNGVRWLNPGCIGRPNKGAPASWAWLELTRGEPIGWQLQRI